MLFGFWVILIGFTIGGGILGNMLFRSHDYWSGRSSNGHPIIGGIIGLIIGFIIDILVFGFIATILNMDENIEYIRNFSSKSRTPSNRNSSEGNVTNVAPINPTIINSGDSWVCKKCGDENSVNTSSCKGCGEYR